MLDHETRITILKLQRAGNKVKAIARTLRISRGAVKEVLRSGEASVPALDRAERLTPHLERCRQLVEACKGNLVRVHEELAADGVEISYSGLTSFCRRHAIGQAPKVPAGRYHFDPGEEMQHDTSPHTIRVGGQDRRYQCASLVLCYSRMMYVQVYRHWTRFECRHFLSEAIVALGGAASRCMIDNASIVIARGRGKDAVAADAMKALGGRFGFEFVAHELGDANRSARVERPFDYIENNFYAGRTFTDDDDLNAQLRAWCERVAHKPKLSLKGTPHALWIAERPALRPLPLHIPEVYDVHPRRVDVEGYVNLHRGRYSVDAALIGRQVEVRETMTRVRIYDGHRLVAEHDRLAYGDTTRSTLPEHRIHRRLREPPAPRGPEETLLRAIDPNLAALCDRLRVRHGGSALRAIRRLHRLYLDYPTDALVKATRRALDHGLLDLGRLESMVLRVIGGDYFRLSTGDEFAAPTTPDPEKPCDPKDTQEDDPHPGADRDGSLLGPIAARVGGDEPAGPTDDSAVRLGDDDILPGDEPIDLDAPHDDDDFEIDIVDDDDEPVGAPVEPDGVDDDTEPG